MFLIKKTQTHINYRHAVTSTWKAKISINLEYMLLISVCFMGSFSSCKAY